MANCKQKVKQLHMTLALPPGDRMIDPEEYEDDDEDDSLEDTEI